MIRSSLKDCGIWLHHTISRSLIMTKLYIAGLSFFVKPLPFPQLKQRIMNSINNIQWRDMNLPPQVVIVGEECKICLIPHWHEFDFESLFSSKLSYEKEVFSYLERVIANYDAIIEIGANIGVFSFFSLNILLNMVNKQAKSMPSNHQERHTSAC